MLLYNLRDTSEHAHKISSTGRAEFLDSLFVFLQVSCNEFWLNSVIECHCNEFLEGRLLRWEVSFTKLQASLYQRRNRSSHRAWHVEALDQDLVFAWLHLNILDFALCEILVLQLAHLDWIFDVGLCIRDWKVLASHDPWRENLNCSITKSRLRNH